MIQTSALFCLLLLYSSVGWTTDRGYHAIRNTSRTMIYKSGRAKEVVDLRYRVTTEAGAGEMSNYHLRIPGGDSKFRMLKAEVKTEGKIHEILFDQVKISTNPEGGEGLFEVKDVVIPFNQVKVGSEIQVKYTVEREPLSPGIFGLQGGIANNVLADEESQVFVSDLPLKTMTKDFDEFYSLTEKKVDEKFVVEITPTKQTRLLEGRQLKIGLYAVSTAKSWLQLNQLMSPKYERAIRGKLPEAFQKIVDQAKEKKNRGEQIEFVASELKKILTYSGNWLTVAGRFYPAGHETVVAQAKGDCKDFATSMVAILRQLGFSSHVALTFRSESSVDAKLIQSMAQLPSLAVFNHAIVWAKDSDKKVWWVDPTNPIVIADVLSYDLLGNFSLVLDRTTPDIQFLPIRNKLASETKIDQTVKIKPDNGVEVVTEIEMNPSAYNSFGMIEQRRGVEALKKVFAVMAHPRAKTVVDLEKQSETFKVRFKLAMSSSEWVHEKKGKIASIDVFPPVNFLLLLSGRGAQLEFREEGTIVATTKVMGRKAVDPVEHECYGRSPWVDLDRSVNNVGEDIVILDRMKVKDRIITPKNAQEQSELMILSNALEDCARSFRIITFLDPSQKTAEEVALDKLKGPMIEEMDEIEAEKLANQTNLNVRSYVQRKLLKYYTSEITQAPQDPEPYWRRALLKREMGYVDGDNYLESHLSEALADVNQGFQVSEDKTDEKLLAAKVKILTDLKKYNEAGVEFKKLLEEAPKAFETYYLGYRLNRVQNNLENAEKWLAFAERVAVSEIDKHRFYGQMARLKLDQKKPGEAVAHYENLLMGKLANGWDWHNAALIYCALRNFDKCIEYEKKALEKADFQAARLGLSDALLEKGKLLEEKTNREPAVSESPEDSFLEALKWNPKNREALLKIAALHLDRFKKTSEREHLLKGRPYLDKILSLEPQNPQANQLLQDYTAK